VSDVTLSRTGTGPSARTVLTGAVTVLFVLWTLAAVGTLIYWSGTVLWVAGALVLGGFIWVLRVYLRPNGAAQDRPQDT
jgi:hypothetical protein